MDTLNEAQTLNLNDHVWIRLTEKGRAMLRERDEQWSKLFASVHGRLTTATAQETENQGWSRWQLWVLIETFGPAIGIGCDPPFETTIQLTDPLALSPPSGQSEPAEGMRECPHCHTQFQAITVTERSHGCAAQMLAGIEARASQPSVEAAPTKDLDNDVKAILYARTDALGAQLDPAPAVPLAPTTPEPIKAITFPPDVTAKLLVNKRAVYADKLRAAAELFTDCKALVLEQLPVSFIAALNAGADALEPPGGVEMPKLAAQLLPLLLQIERNCPCGARPETPNTHHHVIGCPVEDALILLRSGGSR
ncbi:MAG: hypothetical protein AB7I50_00635 [Vicinamibacterales bacterium]